MMIGECTQKDDVISAKRSIGDGNRPSGMRFIPETR